MPLPCQCPIPVSAESLFALVPLDKLHAIQFFSSSSHLMTPSLPFEQSHLLYGYRSQPTAYPDRRTSIGIYPALFRSADHLPSLTTLVSTMLRPTRFWPSLLYITARPLRHWDSKPRSTLPGKQACRVLRARTLNSCKETFVKEIRSRLGHNLWSIFFLKKKEMNFLINTKKRIDL